MKNFAIIFLCCIAFACTQSKDETTNLTGSDSQPRDTAEYALSLDSAAIYTHRYDSIVRAALKADAPIRAFTIRAADLLEALGLPEKSNVKYSYVRAYLGMDLNNDFRLFITPVEGANLKDGQPGKDVFLSGPFMKKENAKALQELLVQDGDYVFDFTAPCPNTCPTESPLNN